MLTFVEDAVLFGWMIPEIVLNFIALLTGVVIFGIAFGGLKNKRAQRRVDENFKRNSGIETGENSLLSSANRRRSDRKRPAESLAKAKVILDAFEKRLLSDERYQQRSLTLIRSQENDENYLHIELQAKIAIKNTRARVHRSREIHTNNIVRGLDEGFHVSNGIVRFFLKLEPHKITRLALRGIVHQVMIEIQHIENPPLICAMCHRRLSATGICTRHGQLLSPEESERYWSRRGIERADLLRASVEGVKAIKCPGCQTKMTQTILQDELFDLCRGCGSVWRTKR